jgi:drug/metabolite transporter (DMT)-like permease
MIYEVELRYWQGFSVALVAALVAAIFAVINKQLVSRMHYSVMGAYQMTGALIVSLLGWLCLTPGQLTLPDWENLLWLLILSSLCTVWAYAGYMEVLQRMSVFTVNVIYNLEPVYGIILAAIIFGSQEYMSRGFYAGAAIIIGSVFMVPWLTRLTQRR